jgi:hypothetical protein
MFRGRKPKPTQLKLVTGNPGERTSPKGEPDPGGKPIKPKWLKGRGATLWNEVVGFAFWLTQADSYKLAAWWTDRPSLKKIGSTGPPLIAVSTDRPDRNLGSTPRRGRA